MTDSRMAAVSGVDVRQLADDYGDMLSADDTEHAMELWHGTADLGSDPARTLRETVLQAELLLLVRLHKRGAL